MASAIASEQDAKESEQLMLERAARISVYVCAMCAALAMVSAVTDAMQVKKTLPVVDVRFGQRTVLVADQNKKSLTLVPGAAGQDIWVCAPHDGGKSCKAADEVIAWILANGFNH